MISTKLGSFESEWTPILTKMKDPTDDIGDLSIDKLILIAKKGDRDFAAKNISGLLQNMKDIEILSKNIVQHIDGHEDLKRVLIARLLSLKPVMEKLKKTGDLGVVAQYFAKSTQSIEKVL